MLLFSVIIITQPTTITITTLKIVVVVVVVVVVIKMTIDKAPSIQLKMR